MRLYYRLKKEKFSGLLNFPDVNAALGAHGDDDRIIREVLHFSDVHTVAAPGRDDAAGLEVPNLDEFFVASRDEKAAVGRNVNRVRLGVQRRVRYANDRGVEAVPEDDSLVG
jgi:hypothetical protein